MDEEFADFLLDEILGSQLSNGTIRRSHPEFSKNQTAFALWALSYVPDRERTFLTRALQYFSSVKQHSSAGTFWSHDHNSGWLRTSDAITALIALGASRYLGDAAGMSGLTAEELAVAADYTLELPELAGWLLSRSRTDSNNIHLALRLVGLAEAKMQVSDATLIAAIDAAVAEIDSRLRSRQRSDGGWSYIGTSQASDPLTSAWVGFALDYQNPPLSDDAVQNNIEFLLGAQQADGTWLTTSGLFATRLATTGLVMAYLPVALEFLGNPDVSVHAIDYDEFMGILTAQVRNRGLSDVTVPIEVQFYAGDPLLGDLLGATTLNGLQSEAVLSAAIPASEPLQDIYVVLETTPETPECEIGNNQAVAALTRVEVSDGRGGFDQQAFLVNVEDVNEAPIITSQPVTALHLGSEYDHVVEVADPDIGDAHQFALEIAPSGLFINIRTGRFSYDFQTLPVGDHQVMVSATDLRGLAAQQTFALTVDENLAPIFTSEPVTDVFVGENYVYDVDAEDPDGGPIVYTLRVSPLTMVLDPDTGVIRWTPEPRHVGTQAVQVVAADSGGAETIQAFTILVDQNQAPVITSEPVFSVVVGEAYTYNATATDPDGDAVSFSLGLAPAGMQIDAASGAVSWAPGSGDLGEHVVEVFATDTLGAVRSQVYPAGGVTTFTYDADGNQLSQTNPLGHTTTATYNGRRDQLTQTDALGHTVSFTYNQFGQELTVEDARGNVYDNTYDPFGNLLGVEDPLGNIAAQNINTKGLVSLRRDAEGNETTFTYDDDGNVLTETDPLGNVTTNTWDANGNKLSEARTRTLADGTVATETTTFTYDERNRLLTTTDPLGNTITTEYDLLGRETARIDALGRRTEMDYDVFGRLIETRYPDGTGETRTYDKEGNLLTETDRLGRTTEHVYDLLDREIETIYPDDTPGTNADNPRTFTEYDAAGRVTAEIDANGNRTEYAYDVAGRRTSTTDALGNVFTFDYDADGNLVSQTDARGFTTSHSYDALNRRTQTTHPDASTTQTEYDALERITAEIDQNGIRTEFAYDDLGRLTEVTDALNNLTSFSYDEAGNKLTQTDAEGRTTEWEYDALGRATARILPLGQVEVMSYDAVGNRSGMSDFNGDVTTYTYDVMDRLTRADYHDGSFETHSYDDGGQRIASTHRYGSESWSYDERGRLESHTDIHGHVLSYTYDAQSNRTLVTGPSGTVSYTFDALNRLKTVDDGAITTYQYDSNGNTSKVLFPNGTETGYVYDSQNRLTRVDHAETSTGILFDQQLYDLMPSGHRERITELSGRVVDYIYDDIYRLVEEQTTDALIGTRITSFSYDAVGNRLTRIDGGVSTSYSYDANDRLTEETTSGVTTTFSYDAQGNTLAKTTGGSTTSYAYDPNHRLEGADDGANPIGFAYDASGVRVARHDNAGATLYVVDHNRDYAQVLEEQDAFGGTLTTYTYGHDLLSQDQGIGTSYFHYDGLGSTRKLTNASGAVTDSYVYKAFGTIEAQNGSTDNAYLFTGEQFDEGLSQYYLRARYYDPANGRFTQMDTFQGVNRNPVTLHKYLYANANPVTFLDPSGNAGLFGFSVAQNIGAVLTAVNIAATGVSLFNIVTSDASNAVKAKEIGILAILSLSGYGATKFIVRKITQAGTAVVSTALATGRVIRVGRKVKQTELDAANFLAEKTAAQVVVRGTQATGPDLLINGLTFELKTLTSASEAAIRRSFKEAIRDGQGLGGLVIDGLKSGLTRSTFEAGFASAQRFGYTQGMRRYKVILGDGSILSWP